MRRKVQLWRFLDENATPTRPIPAGSLHRFLAARDAADDDLAFTAFDLYETHLVPVKGTAPHVVLHRIRHEDLPSQRRNRKVIDLDPSVNELAEGSHFLFLERNLVAFMGSGFSPARAGLPSGCDIGLAGTYGLSP